MGPLGKAEELWRFRQIRADHISSVEQQAAPESDQVGAAAIAATHFGTGSDLGPITVEAWERTMRELGSRGGLEAGANQVLIEIDLVIPPVAQKLRLDPAFRKCCSRQHAGYCKAQDAAKSERLLACHSHLAHFESEERAGMVCYRFCGIDSLDQIGCVIRVLAPATSLLRDIL